MNKDNKQTAPAHVEAEQGEKVVPGTTIPEQAEKGANIDPFNEDNQAPTTQAAEIAALQKEAADALNKLLQAMRAAGFPVYTPVHFWGLAFEPKHDEDFNLYYKPTDLTGADCLKHGYGKEDEEPDTEPFVWKPTQQKEPHHINSTSGHNVRILGGRKE